jgi:hypothetical protein
MKTDRNDRYPRAASVLHAFADPPYGFCIFKLQRLRSPRCDVPVLQSFPSALHWTDVVALLHCYDGSLGSSQKSKYQTPHAARLRCSMLDARCSMLDARCSLPHAWSISFPCPQEESVVGFGE